MFPRLIQISILKYYCFILGFGLLPAKLISQSKTYILRCEFRDLTDKDKKKFSYEKLHADSVQAGLYLNQYLRQLQREAYWEALVLKKEFLPDTLKAYIQVGKAYRWSRLDAGNLEKSIMTAINFKEKYYKNRYFSYPEIELLKEEALQVAEQQGYPFAQIRLEVIAIKNQQVSARLQYDPGVEMLFDTLIVEGSAKVKKKYLHRLLNIRKGAVYNQNLVKQSGRTLRTLPFLNVRKEPGVIFDSQRAYVKLALDQKKSNQIDGILGILPNENNGNTLVTGEFNLELRNLFNSGKEALVKWQSLQPSSQSLQLAYTHPVLFGSRIDVSAGFYLIRQDSSFVNREIKARLFYNLLSGTKLSLGINSRSSTLGSENLFQEFQSLPEVSELRYFTYDIGFQRDHTDDFFFPRRGSRASLLVQIGNKNLIRNPFVVDTLYEGITLKSTQVQLEGLYEKYFSLSRRQVIQLKLTGGSLINPNLFQNELFRLGGIKSLRGHNENTFFASNFALSTIEWRWFFDRESYFLIFYDQAYVREKIIDNLNVDFPLGIGAGLSFSIKAGVFNLIYSLGRSEQQILGFGRSKVHFGFVSRF